MGKQMKGSFVITSLINNEFWNAPFVGAVRLWEVKVHYGLLALTLT